MKNKYSVFQRFGYGHNSYVGDIEGSSTKAAFKNAVIKYWDAVKYDKYTDFYVRQIDNDNDDFVSYGYGKDGQRVTDSGFRSSLKEIIVRILESKSLSKSIEGFDLKA